MGPIIEIVRHAEALHNVGICGHRDSDLTDKGRDQCERLREEYPHMTDIKYVVASPLVRALDTALTGFVMAYKSPVSKVVLLPELQELSTSVTDIGRPLSILKNTYGEFIDTEHLNDDEHWYWKSLETPFFPTLEKVEERARVARVFIRQQAQNLSDGDRLVVVTHGGFAHHLVQNYAGLKPGSGAGVWQNAKHRSFQFVDLHGNDDQATLEEIRDENSPNYLTEFADVEKQFAISYLAKLETSARAAIEAERSPPPPDDVDWDKFVVFDE
ncbi:phosphoglycerate mutase-like protein [Nemania sp. FL0916]|nr:phosphoglycerate mutase-like protein [Nemania sp. FL0916]